MASLNPLTDAGTFFVRLNSDNIARFPDISDRISAFDAGPRPAAQAATDFLRRIDVAAPQESLTRLWFLDGALVGFYALASCSVRLSTGRKKALAVQRNTQPGVLLAWVAKSATFKGDGLPLIEDALFEARKSAEHVAATVLALDPFDAGTAELWQTKHGFKPVTGQLEPGVVPRLFVPLHP